MKPDKTLEISLFLIRISTAAFFLVWSIGKLVAVELTQTIAQTFYSSSLSIPGPVAAVIGILQLAIVLVFLAGLLKTWSYGAVLGMHAVSVLVAHGPLLDPYTPPNTLFWAGVPTLGAIIALFLLRDRDQLFTLEQPHRSRPENDNATV
ncbi:MAG: DoxX protein [Cyanobacteria bacterium J06635_1]